MLSAILNNSWKQRPTKSNWMDAYILSHVPSNQDEQDTLGTAVEARKKS